MVTNKKLPKLIQLCINVYYNLINNNLLSVLYLRINRALKNSVIELYAR